MLSVADFILAICWMLSGTIWLRDDTEGTEGHFGFCYFLAIITVVRMIVIMS